MDLSLFINLYFYHPYKYSIISYIEECDCILRIGN
jgi:hypothetical protein